MGVVYSYFAGLFRSTPKADNPTNEEIQKYSELLRKAKEAKEKAEKEMSNAKSRAEASLQREKKARNEKEEACEREMEARQRAQAAETRVREAEAELAKERARFETEQKGMKSEDWGLSAGCGSDLDQAIVPAIPALLKRAQLDVIKYGEEVDAMVLEVQKREAKVQMAADDARKLQEQAEECLQLVLFSSPEGYKGEIQPEVWPTEEEYRMAKDRIQYDPEKIHLAVCGNSGSGKSSLINAFRGLKNNSARAAPTGVIETTKVITRHPDTRRESPYNRLVWFDCPGAGTLTNPSWQYFNQKGLFIFDVIVLVYDARFTELDVCIIQNCERFKIPLFIVRSKADTHIRNIMEDLGYDESDDDAEETFDDYQAKARRLLIDDTRKNIEADLQEVGLAIPDIFIVTSSVIYSLMTNKPNKKTAIDEARLIKSILEAAYERRYGTRSAMI